MEKNIFLVLLLCSIALISVPAVHGRGPISPITTGATTGTDEVRNWYKDLPLKKQKVTEFHFYLQDIVSGPNPTNIPIATANFTKTSPTYFGLIGAIDDPLTSGPSPKSSVVGRAQGLVAQTALDKIAYHMTFDIVFTNGEYNGSTLSIAGHNPFMDEQRELPVTGGSGAFRLATGTALLHTVTLDETTGDAVVEYNVIVVHY